MKPSALQRNGFRRQYSEYLQVQKNLPEAILLKRQGDLQMSMERGLAFRREAENLLKKAETDSWVASATGGRSDSRHRCRTGLRLCGGHFGRNAPISQPRKVGRHYSLRESTLAQRAMTARAHHFFVSIPLHT